MVMRIVVLSADRGEYKGHQLPDGRIQGINYSGKMLDNLTSTGILGRNEFLPIPIIVGTPSTEYLGKYEKDPSFQVVSMSPQVATSYGLEDLVPVQRCALNYIMCWRYALEKMEWDRLLILEDDIVLAPGWLEFLERVLKEIDSKYAIPPLVTLYRPVDRLMGTQVGAGLDWFEISNPTTHWGMQAFVYHRSHFFDLSTFFKEVLTRVVKSPNPEILEWVLWEHLQKLQRGKDRVKMVATCPSLVQHHGDSSLVGSGIHRALYVLGDTVRYVDASSGPLKITLPVLERPEQTFYIRRTDLTTNAVEVHDTKGTRLATINAKGTFSFTKKKPPPATGRRGIPPGHPGLRPARAVLSDQPDPANGPSMD